MKPPKLVSPARVNRSVTEPLRKILLRARDVWGEEISPIAWKKHRLKEPQERVRELKCDEEAKLFKALPTQYHKIVRFALLTACRLSECVMLEWPAVDWGGRTVTIFGKGDKLARIPMSVGIRDLLWSLQGAHKKRALRRSDFNQRARHGVRKGVDEGGDRRLSLSRSAPHDGDPAASTQRQYAHGAKAIAPFRHRDNCAVRACARRRPPECA